MTPAQPLLCPGFFFCDRVVNVHFGSKAEVPPVNYDVCFIPESGHRSVSSIELRARLVV
jgi:hypothetical protein